MDKEQLSLDNNHSLTHSNNLYLYHKIPENSFDLETDENNRINPETKFKEGIGDTISTPFNTNSISVENYFDEKKIRAKLKEILPKEDNKFIKNIIDDKNKFFPNDLKIVKRVFRGTNTDLLHVEHGVRKGFDIPNILWLWEVIKTYH